MQHTLNLEIFPEYVRAQASQLHAACSIVQEWNDRINVISRKDSDKIVEHHLLPSLAFSQKWSFPKNSRIIDIGTGGGFPGLILAIIYPNAKFTLLDSVGKKLKVIDAVVEALDLNNVETVHARAASQPQKRFDYVMGRAVTALPRFLAWSYPLLKPSKTQSGTTPRGIYYWKGGELEPELITHKLEPKQCEALSDLLPNSAGYEGKYIAHYDTGQLLSAASTINNWA